MLRFALVLTVATSALGYKVSPYGGFGYPGIAQGGYGGLGFGGGGGEFAGGFGGGREFAGGFGGGREFAQAGPGAGIPYFIGPQGIPIAAGQFYPGLAAGGAGIGAAGGIPFPQAGAIGIGNGFIQPRLPPVGIEAIPVVEKAHGGEFIDKKVYGDEKKNLKDVKYEAGEGKQGEELEESEEGYKKEKAAAKNAKANAAAYVEEEKAKKLAEEGKQYEGGKHLNKEGKNEHVKKINKGYKKGHAIKKFKKHHSKSEDGKREEFFDEDHDEGEAAGEDDRFGSFGEAEKSSYKGAHEDEEFRAKEGKKHGYHNLEHILDKDNGAAGQFGKKKFGESSSAFGFDKGVGEEILKGSQEDSKFIKHHPFFGY